MPMIDLTIGKDTLDRVALEALTAELTRLVIKWEDGTDRPGYDKASWAFVNEVDLIEVGGRPRVPGGRQVFRVTVTVPKGTLDDRRRTGLINDVAHAVVAAEGGEPTLDNLMRVWCIVNEVPDGNWGVGPAPMRLRDVVARFGVQPDEPRWNELLFDQR
jgi:phenylpyruvate tautomerase PptA (4-oxalocrotonate tautomerase family)